MKLKICLLFLLSAQIISAQNRPQEIDSLYSRSPQINKQEITRVVTKIASLIKEKYVFAGKGRLIADSLLKKSKQNEFTTIKNWQSLADSLTSTIQALSNDGHMYVRNQPKTVKELIEAENKTNLVANNQPTEDPFYYGTDAVQNNFGFQEVKVLQKNIGYIKLSEINISEKSLPTLYASMLFVANTKALIIDLRDNGGGGSDVGAVFESYFLPRDIPLLEFVNRNAEKHIEKTVTWLTEKKYYNPIFIIINNKTGSAAEAFAFTMQHQKRAKIVGQHSGGAANMNSWYIVNDYLFVSISTSAPTIPGTETSWEKIGVRPDFEVDAGKEIDFIMSTFKK